MTDGFGHAAKSLQQGDHEKGLALCELSLPRRCFSDVVVKLRIGLFALALTFAGEPVVAGPWEDAVAAYMSGDYETAVRLMRPLAENGSALGVGSGEACAGSSPAKENADGTGIHSGGQSGKRSCDRG